MQRAYSLLQVKAVDDEQRIIEGIATTPKTDRMEDVVDSEGAVFKTPLPFLWQHRAGEPIGNVISAKVSPEGINVRVQLAQTDEPGELKSLLDRAWQSIKLKLVRGLSIGFRILESSDIRGTFGLHITRWEWLELSAVTIPANIDATIQTIKQYDTEEAAAPGTVSPTKSPGASGPVKAITHPSRGTMKKTIAEQIRDYEATRAAKSAAMDALMAKADEAGATLDQAQAEEYDGLEAEVKAVDEHLVRLRNQEARNVAAATVVDGNGTEDASRSRSGIAVVKGPEKLEPGIEFARFAMCLAAAKGDVPQALVLAQRHYPQQQRAISVLKAAAGFGLSMGGFAESMLSTKANVVAGTTTDATWAGPLLDHIVFVGDFLEYLRPRTILGQFGQNGVPDLNRIPFNVHIKGQTSGGTGYWVGEGKPKPVTKFDFNDTYHGFYKVAAIAVLTEELIRFSNPSAERLVRDALGGALVEKIDTSFVDPAAGLVVGVSPASITNGVASIASSGDTADDVRADIMALWADAIAANLPMTSAVYITTPSIALALSLMVTTLGQPEFPGISMRGGTLLGVPVIVSNHVDAGTFILAFASEIWLSDDGTATVDASREASIQMLDNPTNDSVTPTATTMVSMFQTDSVALRAHRFINWSKRRSTAVRWLHAVSWGGAGS